MTDKQTGLFPNEPLTATELQEEHCNFQNPTFNNVEWKLITEYLSGKRIKQVAKETGLSYMSVYEQLKKPEVQRYIQEVQVARIQAVILQTTQDLEELMDLEMDLCKSASNSHATRLKAIQGRVDRLLGFTKARKDKMPDGEVDAEVLEALSKAPSDS